MTSTAEYSVAEIDRLRNALAESYALIEALRAQNEELRAQIALLQREFKRLLRGRGGAHLIDEGQGTLFSADLPPAPVEEVALTAHLNEAPDGETPDDSIKNRHKPKKRARQLDASALPRQTVVHELTEEQRVCPVTGVTLVAVGEKVFEELDYTAAKLSVIEHHRVVYGPAPEVTAERKIDPVVTPLPPRPLKGCAASARLLAQVLVQKYEFHLPLYRQEEVFQQSGLFLPRQTLCDWVMGCAELLAPLADLTMAQITAGPVLCLDDTRLKCRGEKGHGYHQAYLWTFTNPQYPGVAFRFTNGRSAEDLRAQLCGTSASYLIGDAYAGNKAAAREAGLEVTHGGCWAHVLRGFRDAQKEGGKLSNLFREDIRALYEIEREADEAELDHASRLALRRSRARPILARIFRRTLGWKDLFSTAGKMGGAIRYMRNARQALKCFLQDGRVPLDNNACENAIRPVALGRKNFLFAGSARGGHAAATVYSLIESCKIAGIDRFEYLADVLVRITTHSRESLAELLPQSWKRQSEAAAST
jgi:transposase